MLKNFSYNFSRTMQIYRSDISYECEFRKEFKILSRDTERGVYTTSEQRRERLYTLYIAWRVPARRSRKAARKSKGGQERRCAAAGLTATSGGIRYVYSAPPRATSNSQCPLLCFLATSSLFPVIVSQFFRSWISFSADFV